MDEYMKTKCARCGQSIEFPVDMAGENAECPACGFLFVFPESKEGEPDGKIKRFLNDKKHLKAIYYNIKPILKNILVLVICCVTFISLYIALIYFYKQTDEYSYHQAIKFYVKGEYIDAKSILENLSPQGQNSEKCIYLFNDINYRIALKECNDGNYIAYEEILYTLDETYRSNDKFKYVLSEFKNPINEVLAENFIPYPESIQTLPPKRNVEQEPPPDYKKMPLPKMSLEIFTPTVEPVEIRKYPRRHEVR